MSSLTILLSDSKYLEIRFDSVVTRWLASFLFILQGQKLKSLAFLANNVLNMKVVNYELILWHKIPIIVACEIELFERILNERLR